MAVSYRPLSAMFIEKDITRIDEVAKALGITRHKFIKEAILDAVRREEEKQDTTDEIR